MNRSSINECNFASFVSDFARSKSRVSNRRECVKFFGVPGKFILEEIDKAETISNLWGMSSEEQMHFVDLLNNSVDGPRDLSGVLVDALLKTLPDLPEGNGPNAT